MLVASAMGAAASQRGAPGTHLLLQLHTDGIGFLEEDGIAPEQVTEGGELVPLPLPKGPEGQLKLPLRPLHCGDTEGQSPHHWEGAYRHRGAQGTHSPLFCRKHQNPVAAHSPHLHPQVLLLPRLPQGNT